MDVYQDTVNASLAWVFRNLAKEDGDIGIVEAVFEELEHSQHSQHPAPAPAFSEQRAARLTRLTKLGKSHVVQGFVQSFLFGYGLQAVINLLSAMVSGRLSRRNVNFRQEFNAIFGGPSAVGLGLALGFYSAIYKIIKVAIIAEGQRSFFASSGSIGSSSDQHNRQQLLEFKPSRVAATFLAGAVAGLALNFEPSTERQHLIAIYATARMLDAVYESAVANHMLPIPPVPYGAAILFALCQVPIMSASMIDPAVMDRGFYNLVLKWSGDMSDYTLDPLFRQDGARATYEENFHTGSCAEYAVHDTYRVWWLSFRIYLPLYLVPLVTMRYRKLAQNPTRSIATTLWKTNSSAWFLASYVSFMKRTQCAARTFRHYHPAFNHRVRFFWDAALGGLMTGFSLLFEDESRHRELFLYVLPRALEICWNYAAKHGRVHSIGVQNSPFTPDILLFCLFSGVVAVLFEARQVPEGSVLDRIFRNLFA